MLDSVFFCFTSMELYETECESSSHFRRSLHNIDFSAFVK